MKQLVLSFLVTSSIIWSGCGEDDETSFSDQPWGKPCEITTFSLNGVTIPTTSVTRNLGSTWNEGNKSDLPSGAIQTTSFEFLVPIEEKYTIDFDESVSNNSLEMAYSSVLAFDMTIVSEQILGTQTLEGQLYQIVQVSGSTSRTTVTASELDAIRYTPNIRYYNANSGAEESFRFGQSIQFRF